MVWRFDTQDSPVVPAAGCVSNVRLRTCSTAPDIAAARPDFDFAASLTQLSADGEPILERRSDATACSLSVAWARRSKTSRCRPTSSRWASPFRLGAYGTGEIRGSTLLRRDRRLSPADWPAAGLHGRAGLRRAAGWRMATRSTNGRHATWRTNGGVGVVMDTLVGPVDRRRLVGLRRTVAHLCRRGPHVSLSLLLSETCLGSLKVRGVTGGCPTRIQPTSYSQKRGRCSKEYSVAPAARCRVTLRTQLSPSPHDPYPAGLRSPSRVRTDHPGPSRRERALAPGRPRFRRARRAVEYRAEG